MLLELFRVSLKFSGNLFVTKPPSREDWIRMFFSEHRRFVHRKKVFHFVPEKNVSGSDGSLLFGYIAREAQLKERSSPSSGLIPSTHTYWQAALIVIDPSSDASGQKIGMEYIPLIGQPWPVLSSLFSAMSSHAESVYLAEVHRIAQTGSFKKWADEQKSGIKKISFDVSSPNMFGDRNDFQNELRSLRDKENVSRVRTTLESDGALNQTDRMEEIADYTERGAGTLKAVAVDGSKYSSDKHGAEIEIFVPNHNEDKSGFLSRIFKAIKDVF
ncbi:hypothetical protein ACIKTA_08530 [Hansschlegelia beijingensis]